VPDFNCGAVLRGYKSAKEETMKQVIILLATVILGIAISLMILTFRGTTELISKDTQTQMKATLNFKDIISEVTD
jgi:preprotein translocase subunit SecG